MVIRPNKIQATSEETKLISQIFICLYTHKRILALG